MEDADNFCVQAANARFMIVKRQATASLLSVLISAVFLAGCAPEMSKPLELVPPINFDKSVSMLQPYVSSDSESQFRYHDGLDFFSNADSVAVYSALDGRVRSVEYFQRPEDGAFQLNLLIESAEKLLVSYSLEPSGGRPSADEKLLQSRLVDEMMDSLLIAEGDQISAGQQIGVLRGYSEFAHIHFSVTDRGKKVCPATFFNQQHKREMIALAERWLERLYGQQGPVALCN